MTLVDGREQPLSENVFTWLKLVGEGTDRATGLCYWEAVVASACCPLLCLLESFILKIRMIADCLASFVFHTFD